ncbi:fatty-acyl-CoA synthase [Mycolicibacterium chitae]|uniref:Long-chain-fatty-acid--CoA ligase FadD13 n=2 Tax=Mycolicibacterium TaxID=1866885 RepID=A0A3S4SZS2_MYCCI|nr:AMP-binding protein [Mycolicibacterium chitae]BBZ03786.1 fatty-acyl-CoA synthase [Mycolicibacterium chitae]VEG47440.1 acyl-CoA synthetase [Mycolicibacterium chitae]
MALKEHSAASYVKGSTDTPLLTETIGANLDRMVAAFGDREALVEVSTGRRWTYREFDKDTRRTASGLLALGLRPGDRVGIWSPNTAEWTLVQYASARIGAILVTINPAYQVKELEYVLNQSGIRTVIAASSFKTSDYEAMLAAVAGKCPDLQDVIIVGSDAWQSLAASPIDDAALADVAAGLTPHDPINIQYTSGTTGFPKGAKLTHSNILNNGYFVGEGVGYTEHDRVCIPVPFYHCFGMVMGNLACTSHGSTMVIPAPGFDPAATLAAVSAERCTSLYGVPTMFIAELALENLDSYDLGSLRTGIMAGSPCPEVVMTQVIEQMNMGEVAICYGMTETSPVSTQTRPSDTLVQRTGTVGTAGPHLEIKVVDPDSGEIVARGAPGELCTRGYSVMAGYWNDPKKTAEVLDADGWMHTGDIAVMDDDGYVAITGRIKDMVIRGGENVYPREIEEFLYQHPDVIDAQVVGVPDERYGEELMAWLRIREGAAPPTAESIREFCAGRIAHYKIPRHVAVIDDYPMTVTGKVRKIELRERAVEQLRREEAQ